MPQERSRLGTSHRRHFHSSAHSHSYCSGNRTAARTQFRRARRVHAAPRRRAALTGGASALAADFTTALEGCTTLARLTVAVERACCAPRQQALPPPGTQAASLTEHVGTARWCRTAAPHLTRSVALLTRPAAFAVAADPVETATSDALAVVGTRRPEVALGADTFAAAIAEEAAGTVFGTAHEPTANACHAVARATVACGLANATIRRKADASPEALKPVTAASTHRVGNARARGITAFARSTARLGTTDTVDAGPLRALHVTLARRAESRSRINAVACGVANAIDTRRNFGAHGVDRNGQGITSGLAETKALAPIDGLGFRERGTRRPGCRTWDDGTTLIHAKRFSAEHVNASGA